MSALLLREVATSDAKTLTDLTIQLGYLITYDQMENRIDLFRNSLYGKVFVAELNGNVVGYVALWIREHFHDIHRAARILALVVDSNHQRLGIGKKLLLQAEEYARQSGCVSVDLTSAHRRAGAHEFYENMGYGLNLTKYFSKDL